MVADVAGKAFFKWDSRSQIHRHRYDALQRPTHVFVQKTQAEGNGVPGETPEDLTDRLLVRTIYGESLDPAGPAPTTPSPPSPAQALNIRGEPYLLYDCAGKVKNDQYDFKQNLLSSTRRLASDFQNEPNWTAIENLTDPVAVEAAADTQLDLPVLPPATTYTVFTVQTTYDALNRVTSRTTPDASATVPTYNEAGLLESLAVGVRGATPTIVIANVEYNARGQRLKYDYADPVVGTPVTCEVSYQYDPFSFRLTHVTTNRLANGTVTPPVSAATLQALLYTYDPVGNVVEVDDAADTAPIFTVGATQLVSGKGLYRHDSLYRLIQAEGREHPGQQPVSTQPRGEFDIPVAAVPHPNDMQALLRYKELFSYDQVGNILLLAHTTTQANGTAGASNTIWTRTYNYEDATNRLISNNDPDATGGTATYAYTGNGAMKRMAHLPVIEWDYADRMRHANKGTSGGDVFCTYDATGERVRKVFVTGTLAERIYVGGWETYRARSGTTMGSAVTQERETLHVMDDNRRIAMVETTTIGTGPAGPKWRFQLGNLLDSSVLELDAEGRVISYEEYHPYGSTAFRSFGSTELSAKRYRNTGKEKDDETGLYYHGARYYVPWLGRWTATDPAGVTDGLNLYSYSRNNPVVLVDPGGTQSCDPNIASCPEENVSTSTELQSKQSSPEARKVDLEREQQREGLRALKEGKAKLPEYTQEQFEEDIAVAFELTETPEFQLALAQAQYLKEQGFKTEQELKEEAELEKDLPSFGKSFIPFYGSGKSAKAHFKHGNIGRGVLYSALTISDVFLIRSLLFGAGRLTLKLAGTASGGRLTARFTAREVARFEAQGFSRVEAELLAGTYQGMGHHVLPRRWHLPTWIQENPLNILKPAGISRGRFYELHFKVDKLSNVNRLGARGVWNGKAIGLTKAGPVGYIWHVVPGQTAATTSAIGHGAAYWDAHSH